MIWSLKAAIYVHRSPLHWPSSGFHSSDIAGMSSNITASLTSVMHSSSTHMSILEILHVWSSPPWQTGNTAACQSTVCTVCNVSIHVPHICVSLCVVAMATFRCYITLTQSLHLAMSGTTAGPAGTGKTETTKDLGRAMGVMVYIFNCSEQMDYKVWMSANIS